MDNKAKDEDAEESECAAADWRVLHQGALQGCTNNFLRWHAAYRCANLFAYSLPSHLPATEIALSTRLSDSAEGGIGGVLLGDQAVSEQGHEPAQNGVPVHQGHLPLRGRGHHRHQLADEGHEQQDRPVPLQLRAGAVQNHRQPTPDA
eukprot:scaffold54149_cov17-Tisochrysis_lutea.AAC.1